MNGNLLEDKYLHMRCCAHILNLVVCEGLKDCDESIVKVRNAVRYVRSSPSRLEKFKLCADYMKIGTKKLVSFDVQTRWNSTYLMLESAEKFQAAFLRLETDDSSFVHTMCARDGLGPPTREGWEKIRIFVMFLKVFFDATVKLSGSLYVTSNIFFPELCQIQSHLIRMSKNDNAVVRNMAIEMKAKYDKYWSNVEKLNMMIFVASVLDPRGKLGVVEYWLKKIYTLELASTLISFTKCLLEALFDEYNIVYGDSNMTRPHVY